MWSSVYSISVFAAFLATVVPVCAQLDSDAKALQEQLLAYEFPIASELKPEYPSADTSAIAAFRVQLHRDFSALLELGVPGDSAGVLGAYLAARDQWLEDGTLTETVFGGGLYNYGNRCLSRPVGL
jgi:hypothetical protein